MILPGLFAAAALAYALPRDARVTLVVEDPSGRRVRNLVSDAPRPAGDVSEPWDGRDDRGIPVPAGDYRWRGIARDREITAHWLGAFYSPGSTPWKQHTRPGGWNLRPSGAGGWLSDHAAPWCVYADDTHVYLGCRIAEAGDSIIQCDLDGNKLWGTLWLGLSGADAICTEGDTLFVAGEGGWMGERMAVNRFDIRHYRWIPNPREVTRRHILHDSAFVREDSSRFRGIAGLFLDPGHIAVAFADQNRVSYFDRHTALWSHDEPIETLEERIRRPSAKLLRGVATDADGNLYRVATNAQDQCIRVFSPDGAFLRTIGKPGGRREGRYDPEAMGHPGDVAIDARGQVWVAETTLLPKRVSVWTREGALVREFVGTPFYGGGGSLLGDFAYYSGMRFRWNEDRSEAELDAILFDPDAHPELPMKPPCPSTVQTWQGRTFLLADYQACSKCTFVGEIDGDVLRPRIEYGIDPSGGVFLWQDGVKTVSDRFAYGAEWCLRMGPNLEIVLRTADRRALAVLTPDADLHYDFETAEIIPLPEELLAVCSLSVAPDARSFVVNRGGCGNQGSPDNLFGAISREGKTLWTYPNPYPSNTHNSPIPRRGELRHTLGIEGFSSAGPGGLMLLNGNKGTRYLFTQDGLFVQELFGDMRVNPAMQDLPAAVRGLDVSHHSLGDECFYGWFGDIDGIPHLIEGKDSLNLLELRGVDSICVLEGGSIAIAEPPPPLEDVPLAERGPARAICAGGFGLRRDWWKLAEYPMPHDEPVARFAIGWTPSRLTLHYDVTDPTPFENLGDAPHTLFHSGDALDFRWEGDPGADPARTSPAPGDVRIVVAPMEDRVVAMRYRFVDPAATEPPVEFVSPAGRISIAGIEEIADAQIDVHRRAGGYSVRIDLPWEALGEPRGDFQGGIRRCDAGVLFGDPSGTRVVRRQYLFDAGGQEVSDIPSEARVDPSAWGAFEF